MGEVVQFKSTDDLFEKLSISQIRSILSSSREDAAKTSEEIKNLVGLNYRRLIGAADMIVEMDAKSSTLTSSIHDLPRSLTSLLQFKTTHLGDLQLKGKENKIVPPALPPVYTLLQSSDIIWRSLDDGEVLQAATLYLASAIVSKEIWSPGEISKKENACVSKSLILSSCTSLPHFCPRIVKGGTRELQRVSVTSDDVAKSLLAITLLEMETSAYSLRLFLDSRTKVFLYILNCPDDQVLSLKAEGGQKRESTTASLTAPSVSRDRLDLLLSCVQSTIVSVSDIFSAFTPPNKYHRAIEATVEDIRRRVPIKPASNTTTTDPYTAINALLDAAIGERSTGLGFPSSPSSSNTKRAALGALDKSAINVAVSAWLKNTVQLFENSGQVLASVSSAGDLANIQRHLLDVVGRWEGEWARVCQDVVITGNDSLQVLDIWSLLFAQVFKVRANQLLAQSFTALQHNICKVIEDSIAEVEGGGWKRLPEKTADDFVVPDTSIQLCQIFEDEIKSLIEDSTLLVSTSSRDTATAGSGTGIGEGGQQPLHLQQSLRDGCTSLGLSLVAFMKGRLDNLLAAKGNAASPSRMYVIVLIGRICWTLGTRRGHLLSLLGDKSDVLDSLQSIANSAVAAWSQETAERFVGGISKSLTAERWGSSDRQWYASHTGWEVTKISDSANGGEGDEVLSLPTQASSYVMQFLYNLCQEEQKVCASSAYRNAFDQMLIEALPFACWTLAIDEYTKLLSSLSSSSLCESAFIQLFMDVSLMRISFWGIQAPLRKANSSPEGVAWERGQTLLRQISDLIDPVDWTLYESPLQENLLSLYKNTSLLIICTRQSQRETRVQSIKKVSSSLSKGTTTTSEPMKTMAPVSSRFTLLPVLTSTASNNAMTINGSNGNGRDSGVRSSAAEGGRGVSSPSKAGPVPTGEKPSKPSQGGQRPKSPAKPPVEEDALSRIGTGISGFLGVNR